jgi:hypothetical protein
MAKHVTPFIGEIELLCRSASKRSARMKFAKTRTLPLTPLATLFNLEK